MLGIDFTLMKRRPLFIQLFYSYVPIIIIALIVLVFFINQIIRDFYYRHVKEDLYDRAILVSKLITHHEDEWQFFQELVKTSGKETNMRITVVDEGGVVIADSDEQPFLMDNHLNRPEIIQSKLYGVGSSQRFSTTLNQEMMYLAIPLLLDKNNWTVRVSMSLSNLEMIIKDLQKQVVYLGVVIGFSLLFISFYFSRKVTIPLQSMRKDAESFVETFQLTDPLTIPKTKELASLAISLNKMAVEIEKRIKIIQHEKDDREELLSSMQEGIISLDNKMKVLSINDIAKEYLHIEPENIIGEKVTSIIRQKKVTSFIKKVKKGKGKTQDEIVIKTNKKRTIIFNGTPLIKEKKISGILITMTDITFQKQLERLRQNFVANVSHELKTPITSILGYMEIIQSSDIEDDKKHDFYGKVLNQTNRMNDIIDDLLRLSKIESQEEDSSIDLVSMEIKAILEGSVDDVLDKAQKNNNRILIHCNDIRASVDAQLLREAIANLLENSVKYGDSGRDIKIIAEADSQVLIHIENSGQRISEKHRDKVFQRFYRIDKSRDRKAGGTGLGLAIVKHIALVHGGEVFVSDSKKDKCRFTISLPKIS